MSSSGQEPVLVSLLEKDAVPFETLRKTVWGVARAGSCAYCSAHACTFALRRGATVEDVASALEVEALAKPDAAAVRVARALALVPTTIDDVARREMRQLFSAADEEWVVLSIAMMGWLNKTMDGLGVPLEEPTVAEVRDLIAPAGWKPGKHMPGALPATTAPPRADCRAGTRVSRPSVGARGCAEPRQRGRSGDCCVS